jgi:phage FluMu protein Com
MPDGSVHVKSERPERPMEEVRCRTCRVLLCKTAPDSMKSSGVVEIKCRKCDDLNYIMGRPE